MSEPRERYTPADYYERRYHLLVERFNALSGKREQLEQQLEQALALLDEMIGAYERHQTDEEFALEMFDIVEKARAWKSPRDE